jgi:hypothetical protein
MLQIRESSSNPLHAHKLSLIKRIQSPYSQSPLLPLPHPPSKTPWLSITEELKGIKKESETPIRGVGVRFIDGMCKWWSSNCGCGEGRRVLEEGGLG